MKKKSMQMRGFLLISLVLILSMMPFLKNPVAALSSPTISVVNLQTGKDNFTFYTNTNTTTAGSRFNVTLEINEGTDVAAWQVYMTYNNTLLNATRAWFPSASDQEYIFYGKATVLPPPYFYYSIEEGAVTIGDTTVPVVGVNFTTTKKLATIEFKILKALLTSGKVVSNLAIDNADTYLLDSSVVNEIPTAKANGYYEFIWLKLGLEVKPSIITAVELKTFNISVWLNNVTSSSRLVSLKFKLRYNTTLLSVTKVTEGLFLKQFGGTDFLPMELGDYVKVNVTLTPNVGYPEGSGTIANITFQSIYQDQQQDYSSPLNLFDILLLDSSKNPVTPATPPVNGFYTILRDKSSLITINVNPASVMIESNVTISGTIKPSKVGVNVTIYYRLVGQSWTNLTTVLTGSPSNYTFNWKPTTLGTFELKANWTGDATPTYEAESDIATLTVKMRASAITIDVNPMMVTVGENVTITGAINVTSIGVVNVTIYLGLDGIFSKLSTVQTNSSRQYTYVWTTTEGDTFELYASWLGDNVTSGAESPKTALTVKKFPSAITISIDSATVTVGSDVTINGTITPIKVGANVTIYYRLNATVEWAEWVALATVKTDATSNYNYTWKATKKTLNETDTFQFYAGWPGDEATSSANSLTIGFLTVRRIPSTITVDVNPKTAQVGSNVTINGTITPAKTQTSVIIYYRLTGGVWNTLATVKTESNSSYSYIWTTAKKTLNSSETFELYAWWDGDINTSYDASDLATLTVNRASSTITINVDSSTVTLGSNVTISGTIAPTKAGLNITVYYRLIDEAWISLTTVEPGSDGNYTYIWQTNRTGTFEIEARWPGDNINEPAKSETKTVKVEEPFSFITFIPYILGGTAILVVAIAITYFTKIKKRRKHELLSFAHI